VVRAPGLLSKNRHRITPKKIVNNQLSSFPGKNNKVV
jgi:hypothetical protein